MPFNCLSELNGVGLRDIFLDFFLRGAFGVVGGLFIPENGTLFIPERFFTEVWFLGDREYFPGDLDARDVLLWELCSSIVWLFIPENGTLFIPERFFTEVGFLGDREYFPGDLDARDVLLWELCSSIVSRPDLSDFRELVLGENSHRFTERLSTELSEIRCLIFFLKLIPSFVPRPDSAVFLELDLGEHSDRFSETLSREKLDLSDCESLPGDLDDREVLPFELGKLSKEVDDFSDCESLPGDLVLPP